MSTVKKAMAVLDVFSSEVPSWGLSDLARHINYDKATTLRLLTGLQSHGLLELVQETKKYRIGPAVHRLAAIRNETLSFARVAQPFLDELRDSTGESCHISQAGQNELSTILVSASLKALRVNFIIGEAHPFHCTASGIAYLAFAKPDVLARVAGQPMARMTNQSKTTVDQLRHHIAETKARGFAINNREYEEGTISVAAPIFGHDNFAKAAISVAAPQSRLDAKQVARNGAAAIKAASQLKTAFA